MHLFKILCVYFSKKAKKLIFLVCFWKINSICLGKKRKFALNLVFLFSFL